VCMFHKGSLQRGQSALRHRSQVQRTAAASNSATAGSSENRTTCGAAFPRSDCAHSIRSLRRRGPGGLVPAAGGGDFVFWSARLPWHSQISARTVASGRLFGHFLTKPRNLPRGSFPSLAAGDPAERVGAEVSSLLALALLTGAIEAALLGLFGVLGLDLWGAGQLQGPAAGVGCWLARSHCRIATLMPRARVGLHGGAAPWRC
jgi:hypothetical protein